jgi:CIC family chloride channel protein
MRLLEGLLERFRAREHSLMLTLAALIGLAGGLGSVGFRQLIRGVQFVSWGEWTYTLDVVRAHPWWWILIAPAVGGLLVGPLVFWGAREAKGHGVPEVMEAVALRSGFIRPRLVAVKSLASALTIGTGGSVGREGPIVQIGSALGSSVGQWARVSGPQLRTLVGCGAAAGIAGTFNAPVAGALFAVEVVLGDFAVSEFSPIVISSVLATVVSRHYLGDVPAFVVPPHELVSAWELGPYVVLGLLAAGVALTFKKLLYGLEDRFQALALPEWGLPALGGLMVGALAIRFPEILGVGYEATSAALAGELTFGLVTVLVLVKLLATSVTLGTGGSGGIFAPSLFLGAMTGSMVGDIAHQWLPTVTAGRGAYALVGMGAVVAGATHAPITAILIIFELTSDYKLILPLMVSCIIATVVTTRRRKTSIYTEKLRRRGVEIYRGHELNILRSLRTADILDDDFITVDEGRPLGDLLDLLAREPRAVYYVVDRHGAFEGVIRQPELQSLLLHAEALGPVIVARDLMREEIHTLAPEERLDAVMRVFAERQPDELPVLDPASRTIRGVVSRRQMIEAYNRELMKRDMAAGLGGRLDAARTTEMPVGEDHVLMEVDAPAGFVGRSLQDLAVRPRYGVQVLLIRRRAPDQDAAGDLVPDGSTRIERGDRLVLLGPERAMARFRR